MNNTMTNVTSPTQFNFNSNAIRIVTDDLGNPWFLANDVCAVLGYANPRQAIIKNCRQGGVSKRDTPTESGIQEMTYIDEGNLYRLIIKSRKPQAEPFEVWVCDDVLPTIRKTGQYIQKTIPKAPRAKLALPDGLSLESQDLINDLIAERLAKLPKEKQAGAAISIRSALTTKYGVNGMKHGYKNIPDDQFTHVVNLVSRLPLEADQYLTYTQEELTALVQQEMIKALPASQTSDNCLTINLNQASGLNHITFKFDCADNTFQRWFFSQDGGNFSMTPLPADVLVLDFDKFCKYAAQERGYVVMKKQDILDRLAG